jgi:hypothetical protein
MTNDPPGIATCPRMLRGAAATGSARSGTADRLGPVGPVGPDGDDGAQHGDDM